VSTIVKENYNVLFPEDDIVCDFECTLAILCPYWTKKYDENVYIMLRLTYTFQNNTYHIYKGLHCSKHINKLM
jgi:hypothetical protein